jgi:hypothetical protein
MKGWDYMSDTERLLFGIRAAVQNAKYDHDQGVIDAVERGTSEIIRHQVAILDRIGFIGGLISIMLAILVFQHWH